MMLRGVGAEGAAVVAAKLRQVLGEQSATTAEGVIIPLHVSVGWAVLSGARHQRRRAGARGGRAMQREKQRVGGRRAGGDDGRTEQAGGGRRQPDEPRTERTVKPVRADGD